MGATTPSGRPHAVMLDLHSLWALPLQTTLASASEVWLPVFASCTRAMRGRSLSRMSAER